MSTAFLLASCGRSSSLRSGGGGYGYGGGCDSGSKETVTETKTMTDTKTVTMTDTMTVTKTMTDVSFWSISTRIGMRFDAFFCRSRLSRPRSTTR